MWPQSVMEFPVMHQRMNSLAPKQEDEDECARCDLHSVFTRIIKNETVIVGQKKAKGR
jgi:hypothetical protein